LMCLVQFFCLQFSYSFLCLLSPMVVPLSSVFSHRTSFGWTERFIYIQNFWRLRTEFGLFDRMSQYAVNQWCNSGKKISVLSTSIRSIKNTTEIFPLLHVIRKKLTR
jgi:hypothetical protein